MLNNSQFAVVFLFKNQQEIKFAVECAKSTEQNEDYAFCVARERGNELFHCFQNKINYSLLTSDNSFSGSEVLQNKTILLRGSVKLVKSFRLKNPNLSYLVEGSVVKWPKKIMTAFVKRDIVSMDYSNTLKLFKRPIFIKTSELTDMGLGDSGTKFHMIIKNEKDFKDYINSTMNLSPSFQMIVSDVIDIKKDEFGTREYRCWVSNHTVSSISRYVDYKTNYNVPKEIVDYALDFVKSHGHLPSCYVLDIAETTKGVDIVELNDIECSGRYERNSFDRFLQFIVS